MALSDYDKQLLSGAQQSKIQGLTDQWNELEKQHVALRNQETALRNSGDTAGADAIRSQINGIKQQKTDLNTQAEAVRASEGYLGGSSGTGYTQVAQKKTTVAPTVVDNSAYIQQMNQAKKDAAIASINAAYNQNKAALDRAQVGLSESYQAARNETAGASELAKRNNAQYAAAYGLNSGTGGQMELARNVALQGNLNNINLAEGQSMADLTLQRANAETEYNNAIAQAESQGNYELANQLYQEKVRVQETLLNLQIQQAQMDYQAYRDSVADNQWKQAFNQNVGQQDWQNYFGMMQYLNGLNQQSYNNAFNQTQYNDSQTAQKQSDLANAGWSFLKVGALPSAEMLTAMGMTATDAESYIAAMKAASSTTPASNMTLATAKDLASNGIVTEQSLKVLNDSGYNNDSIKSIYGIDVGSVVSPPTTSTPAYNNGSLRADQVKELQQVYGLSADGFWGPNSQSTTGMSADEAWAQYQKSKGALTLDNATMNTPGYVELVNELSRIEDSGRNVATKAAVAIQEALEDGKITQALADKLFAQYGL